MDYGFRLPHNKITQKQKTPQRVLFILVRAINFYRQTKCESHAEASRLVEMVVNRSYASDICYANLRNFLSLCFAKMDYGFRLPRNNSN